MNYSDALQQVCKLLPSTPNPQFEAQLLLSRALKISRSSLLAFPERVIDAEQQKLIMQLVKRRVAGEPMAYILQEKEFWSLSLKVTADTLIPRPETELLVELALEILPANVTQTIADLGTGSGAVALALAKERPHWQLIATDQSSAALKIAQENATHLGLFNVSFHQGSWCAALPRHGFNAIVSNPPYIAEKDVHLEGDLRFEPQNALVSGKEGLDALRIIIEEAGNFLSAEGWLLLEHGHTQGEAVRTLMQSSGFKDIRTHQDLAGLDRVTKGKR
ncbi:MAG TPA: peptide chain release factor N(5)-glutamine methyltransferase [Gammaproteobacteria bacterium]|nr:peptide chain release factor N(5)-glutamine methyltransferase [Gammaproteobacteria bacterium]